MSLLELRNLEKHFGGLVVTDDVSLSLRTGERAALIGPNGAGKTTLVDLVSGHLRPDRGQVLLAGREVTDSTPAARVRAGLVRSFQVTRLFSEMTPEQHLAIAILQRRGKARRLLGDYRAMPDVLARIDDILSLLDLTAIARTPVSRIAYGQQRLLEIALAIALEPRVLLMDEPAAGVPHGDTALIAAALDRLPADLAVLMVEHDMDFVFRFAHRVIVLAEGAVIFDGAPDKAAVDPTVRLAYLGEYHDDGGDA